GGGCLSAGYTSIKATNLLAADSLRRWARCRRASVAGLGGSGRGWSGRSPYDRLNTDHPRRIIIAEPREAIVNTCRLRGALRVTRRPPAPPSLRLTSLPLS